MPLHLPSFPKPTHTGTRHAHPHREKYHDAPARRRPLGDRPLPQRGRLARARAGGTPAL